MRDIRQGEAEGGAVGGGVSHDISGNFSYSSMKFYDVIPHLNLQLSGHTICF